MPEVNRCPECGAKVYQDDFQCTRCGLLLNPEQVTGEYVVTEPSIVRAFISPAQPRSGTHELQIPENAIDYDEPITELATVPLDAGVVPKLRAKPEVALRPLKPAEARVASFIDGKTSVPSLIKAAKVPPAEAKAVLKNLSDRGLVDLGKNDISDVPTNPGRRKGEPRRHSRKELKAVQPAKPAWPSALQPTPPTPATKQPLKALVKAPVKAAVKERPADPPRPPPVLLNSKATAVAKALEAAKKKDDRPSKPVHLQERQGALPDSPDEYLQKAVALERAGKVDGAIYILKRAIATVRKPAPLYNKLALIVLDQRKDFREAEALLRKAVAAEPANTVYQQNLYSVLALAAEQKNDKRDPSGLWAKLRGK